MSTTPRILVISFSPIHRDSRVLREISALAHHGRVTTVGYGAQPAGSAEHLRIPDRALSLPQTPSGVLTLALRRLKRAEMAAPGTKAALKLLEGRRFDLVVANDARALPLAFAVAHGAPIWADMHEWAPEERTHVTSWRLLVAPLMDHICRTYLPRCDAVTTIGPSIADLYREHYGATARIVRNAAPRADLEPGPLAADGAIRLVHSGGAVPGRSIETMIDAARLLPDHFTLDLYLVPGGDGGRYLRRLQERAQGCDRIAFHAPVPPAELPATLNAYDVGVFWIPPFNTNARLTLPNKLFDFVQARLALAVGPTMEMVRVIEEFGLGVVSKDYSLDSIVETLSSLTPRQVADYKRAAHSAADILCFESEMATIDRIVTTLLNRT